MISSSSDYLFADAIEPARFYGVVVGQVTSNQDPLDLGRVKVIVPALFGDSLESNWAPVVTPMAGNGFGAYFLPEVGDRVLVAFENGMPEQPYVLGSLWGFGHTLPEKNEDKKNNRRLMRSRSGHQIILDDTEEQEKITIADKQGKNTIVIDVAVNTITITSEENLNITARNNIKLDSKGDILVQCSGKFEVKAGQSQITADNSGILLESAPAKLEVKASEGVNLEHAAATIAVSNVKVTINQGALEVT